MESKWKLELSDKIKNIVFFCEGGIGKNIAGTAVVRAIKKQFPDKKITVVAGCPDIFMNNLNVRKIFNFNNALHFYNDLIDQNDDIYIMKVESYLHTDYLTKQKHVVECWCEMLGVEWDGNEPDLFFTPNDIDAAKIYIDEFTNKGKKKFAMFQWIGGKVPNQPDNTKEMKAFLAEMYRRAIPQKHAQEIANLLMEKYNCKVGLIQHQNFPVLDKCERICFPIRATISLLYNADYFIGIDSLLQHAAASKQINKRGIVIWGGTSPICLGYPLHKNLQIKACTTPECHRPNSYLLDMQVNGQMWDCPVGEPCMKRDILEIESAMDEVYPDSKQEAVPESESVSKENCKCPSTK